MHLTCPQCHTEYDVPDAALIGRARTLRCADCGTKFTAPALPDPALAAPEVPPEIPPHGDIADEVMIQEEAAEAGIAAEPDASFEPAAEPQPETLPPEPVPPLPAARTIPAPPPAPKPSRAIGVSILVVLLLIGIILAEHRAIGQAWPPSLRLFNALGLH